MENGKKPKSTLDGTTEKTGLGPNYKTFDIEKAVLQDVRAAVSLLHLILDNPHIMALVVGEIEKIRAKIIEQESLPKREDFHPELTPTK